jgi:predicted metal-dependent hydrolase
MMPTIDQLIRSRRKTIALIINQEGQLIVRAPLRASRAQIEALVAEKADWIRAHQAKILAHPRTPSKEFCEGESFFYLGQSYPLHLVPGMKIALELHDGTFQLAPDANAQTAFLDWYKRQARSVLAERVRLHATRLNLTPGSLRISSARTRWGSCSGRGTLSFTWRLVLAPVAVIDYVVVHELVHLEVKNHSALFWQRVAVAYPSYLAARRWLKENSRLGQELETVSG